MTTTGTPANIRRLANGLPRFAIQHRTESGWRMVECRTTETAALAVLCKLGNAGGWGALRVVDQIDSTIVATR